MSPEMYDQIRQQLQPAQGLLPQPQQPQQPQQPSRQAPTGFGGPGGTQRMQQIYGLLAQQGQNPAAVGQKYVEAMQRQQRLDTQSDPAARAASMFGRVNPYDMNLDSMADFYDRYKKTGEPDFSLLKFRDKMSNHEQKVLTEAIDTSKEVENDLGRMAYLADSYADMARKGTAAGYTGRFNEWLKTATGKEDGDSMIRREYSQLINKNIMAGLPPGSASDADVKVAREGWPPATAGPAYLASFLRGMQKLKAVDLAYSVHAASYLSRHRNQEHQREDWESNKGWLINQAWKPYGGINTGQGQALGPLPPAATAVNPNLPPSMNRPFGGADVKDYSGKSADELLNILRGAR